MANTTADKDDSLKRLGGGRWQSLDERITTEHGFEGDWASGPGGVDAGAGMTPLGDGQMRPGIRPREFEPVRNGEGRRVAVG